MPRNVPTCLYCGKLIKSGRADKKFCDSGCKDSFNNEIKLNERAGLSRVESILKKNMRVLKKLYNPKKPDVLIKSETLIREGFEFGFLTHIGISAYKKNEYTFCYNYGYLEVGEGQYQIVPMYDKLQIKGGRVIKF